MSRRLVVLVILIVLVVLAWLLLREDRLESDELVLYGNVDIRQVDVGFRVMGRVHKLYYDEGDVVKPGDLLAELDQQPYLDQLRQAQAHHESVKAALVQAERTFERRKRLLGSSSVSQQEYEDAESNRDQLVAQLAEAEAAVGTAETNFKDTKAYCPSDGWILTRIREPGTIANVSDPVFTVSIQSPLWIRAYIPEPNLGEIYSGMPAEVHTDVRGGPIYHGKIGFISPMAEFTPKTVQSPELRTDLVFRLRVYVDNPDGFFASGAASHGGPKKRSVKVLSDILVEISGVTKRFPGSTTAALEKISASIPRGRIMGLVGPDGAGKTTLIRLMTGLMLPTEGFIRVMGYDTVKNASELQTLIGYMPQKFGLYEDLTVAQNMNLYADLRGLAPEESVDVFDKLLTFTGLRPFTERLAKDLSGGMKQKLGLACALINRPTLLLLDEPSVGVDPISRRELWQMVHNLIEQGISVVWSTSYLDEAERCDSVLLLNEGKLLFGGPPKELTERVGGKNL